MNLPSVLLAVVALSTASPLFAQPADWAVEFSGGTATPMNDISSRLSTGWDVNAGLGYQLNSWLSLLGEGGVARMGVPANVLQELNAPNGHGRIFSLTVGPEVHFPLTSLLQGFALGGVGWIRRTVDMTAPSVQYFDYYDPFYGDLGPQAVATDQVLSTTTRNAFGGDIGAGVSFRLPSISSDVFVAVRYYYAPTAPRITALLPVTFGIRWTAKKGTP
jgi:opacity protein-like surface antigen